jgi:pimeloyl-ACP methyl ester carboxylesterase
MSTSTTNLSHVEVNGAKLAYRESGEGEPLVLVHGALSDLRAWTAIEAKLSAHFHVYNYSRRFAWPNEPIQDGEPSPWEQDSLDLGAFIEALGIAPVHILGNSSGAFVTLLLARAKPQLFRTLLLEEPPLITLFLPILPPSFRSVLSFLLCHPISFWPVMAFGATTVSPATAHCKRGEYELAISTFGKGVLGPMFWSRAIADLDRKRQIDDNTKPFCHNLRYNTMPIINADDARKIQIPTLVITGMEGPMSQQCIDAELIRVLGAKRKREVKIERAGHAVHEDNPEQVYEEVLKFVFGDKAA